MAIQFKTFRLDTGPTWTDISSSVSEIVLDRDVTKPVDVATITMLTSETLDKDDEIKIEDETTVKYFAGKVDVIDSQISTKEVTVFSYANELNLTNATKIYNNQSPEDIVKDLVDTFSSLTFTSTDTSGQTITRFVAQGTLDESIRKLAQTLNWLYYVDADKKFYLVPKGSIDNSKSIADTEASSISWVDDVGAIVNRVLLTGGDQTLQATESFTASASQTDFTLVYNPFDVEVQVNSVVKTGGIQGSSTADYYVDIADNKVVFNSGLTGGETVDIIYNHKSPIFVDIKDPTSITTYGERSKSISASWILTLSDARTTARGYVQDFSLPPETNECLMPSFINYLSGERVYVTDANQGRSGYYNVSKVTWTLSTATTLVETGNAKEDITFWQGDITQRIKELEKEFSTGAETPFYFLLPETLNINLSLNSFTIYSAKKYDSFVMGLSILGDNRTFDTDAEWNEGVHTNTSAISDELVSSANGATWVSPLLLHSPSSFFTTLENFNSLLFNGTWVEDSNVDMVYTIEAETIANGGLYLQANSTNASASLQISRTLDVGQIMKENVLINRRGDVDVKFYFSDVTNVTLTTTGNPTSFTVQTFDTSTHSGKTITKIEVSDKSTSYKTTLAERAGWDESNYLYRKTITITEQEASAKTNFQALFVTNTLALISGAKMRGDGNDIRIYDNNGTKLDHYVESGLNTTTTRIWVKLPTLNASEAKEIFFYYGYSSETVNESSSANVFIRTFSVSDVEWLFDFNTGSSTDLVNKVTPTITGASITTIGNRQAMQFNGSSDKINLGVSFSQTTNQHLYARARSSGSITASRQNIIGTDNGGYDWGLLVGNTTDGSKYSMFYGSNISAGSTWDTTNFYSLSGDFDASGNSNLYLDGSLDAGPVATGTDSSVNNDHLGVSGNGVAEWWAGYIEIAVRFNRILTSGEITDIGDSTHRLDGSTTLVYVRENAFTDPTTGESSELDRDFTTYFFYDLDVIHTEDTVRATTWENITIAGTYTDIDILDSSNVALVSGLTGGTIDLTSYSALNDEDIKVRINMDNTDTVTSLKVEWKPDLMGSNESAKTIEYQE